jgi:DNA-binding transcriptional MerR regulator
MALTIGELAKLTGITVRALHHYDELGLVVPSQRSAAGYRLYGDGDVLRLQEVLMFRELGLPLAEIAKVLADPEHRRVDALKQHRELVAAKRGRLDVLLAAIDAALAIEEGHTMQDEQVKSLFEGFDHEAYADEAERQWGDSEAFKESARRSKRYGKAEWDAIRREGEAIYARFAELMREGAAASDARVRGIVEAHRAHIDRWFYPCSPKMQRGLAELYVGDPRFTANIDKLAPGLAQYIHDAIVDATDRL